MDYRPACTDDAVVTNTYVVADSCADADPCMCPDRHRTAEPCADGNMRKIADPIIMLHDCRSVDDAVRPDMADGFTTAFAITTLPAPISVSSAEMTADG